MATTSRRGAQLVDFDLMAIKAALEQQQAAKKEPVQTEQQTRPEEIPPELPPEPKKGKNAKAA